MRLRLEELESRIVPTTITRTSAAIFYNDFAPSSGAPLNSAYAAYQITNTDGVNHADVWATIGNFTSASGPVAVTLGTNAASAIDLGPLANGQTKTAFFYLTSNATTAVTQTHTVSVFNGPPASGSLLTSQNFSFAGVLGTINASSNKVNSVVVSPSTPTVGGTFTITVTGATGEIGAAKVLDFTPAAYSSWRADAFQLVGTTITLSGGNTGVFTDTLAIPPGSITSAANTNYTAVYTFQVVGTTATSTVVSPTAYISSGGNVKHTDTGNFASLPPIQPPQLASPTVATAPTPATVTLGTTPVTLKDTADLESGFRPTGVITFTLVAPGGGTLDTETVAVSGNGAYTTPTGFTLPAAGTVTGAYQWNARYSGDAGNNAVIDNNSPTERVTVSSASPTITTSPNPTNVNLGVGSVTLTDTATLAGGYHPTGTITFTLFYNGGATAVDTETVAVNGNGAYTTPIGFTLPRLGAVTGTYQWDATYSGDPNNNTASDTNALNELVTVSAGRPTLTTTPSPTTVTLGSTALPILTDTADLEGGFNPNGAITFTLFHNGSSTPVDTESAAVVGNGMYITPTGFTLPTTGAVTGTYQWVASFSDRFGNNTGITDAADPNEQVMVSAARPSLVTTPGQRTITLGVSTVTLTDTALLSGGYHPTGAIRFTLVAPNGTTVDTETVAVNGNGTYTTPTGFTIKITGGVTGTYQWNATYTGDSNNNPVSDNNNTNEQVTLIHGSPTITTTPSPTTVTLGTSPVTLTDTADLEGGSNPTGAITFTLVAPGGGTVDTETVTVKGDGAYTTPTGFVLSAGAPTGIYQWNASYSGDNNDDPVSNTNDPNERVTVRAATLTLVTAPSPDTVTLGATDPPILTDSAVLAGGFNPTGTITFTLVAPGGGTVDTETVTVNGNGNYTTPTGFTLPTTGTATGTYQWNATYSGDSNNNSLRDNDNANEQVTVSAASPTITTTPSPNTITAGVTLRDTAFLVGGFNPTGTITFTLLFNGGSTPVDTETVSVNGNGSYTTPTGFTPGTSSGTYQWNAVYKGDTDNNTASEVNEPDEQVTASVPVLTLDTTPIPATVTLGTTPVTLNDSADLEGGLDPTGTITFTLFQGATLLNTEEVTVNGDGIYTTPTGFTLPSTGTATGTYQWNATYSGDGTNSPLSDVDNPNEQVTVSVASPALATIPTPDEITLGASPVTLTDAAQLTNGFNPTGTITFTLFQGTTLLDTETATVNGNGTYTTPTGFSLPTTGTAIGTYQWDSTYSGDTNNSSVSDNNAADEQVRVSAASPTLSTTADQNTVTLGRTPVTIQDTAVLQNGYHPTGAIIFTLFFNGGSTPVDTEMVTVNGNGAYTTPTGFTLPSSGTVAGTYQWDATYSGDGNNDDASDNDNADEQVTVSAASPTVVTLANPTRTITLGPTSPTLNDMAVVAGGYNPTGTLLFTLKQGGATVFTQTDAVSGNGSYTTPGFTLPTTGTATGTYTWTVAYSGDGNNSADNDQGGAAEQVIVSAAASPTLTTTPNPSTALVGQRLQDSANLAGYRPTGSITFSLYAPGLIPGVGPATYTETVTGVNGSGTYQTSVGFVANVVGTWHWVATYNGDGNNNTESSATLSEPVTVSEQPADLQISKTDGTTTAIPGATTTYTIVVTNAGPGSVTGATVMDTFPADFTGVTWTATATGGATGFTASGSGNINDIVTMPVGSTITYLATGTISPSATGSLSNTATVSPPADVPDPNPGNNSATDTDTLTPRNDVSVTKTDGVTSAVPGLSTTYTIVVSNNGPSTAINVAVSDPLPARVTSFTWSGNGQSNVSGPLSDIIASLAPGATVTYTIVASINASATGSLINTATVSAANDTNAANNNATDTDTLTPLADLSITKTDGTTIAVPGTNTTYTITVINNGPSTVTGAVVSDVLPAGTTFISATNGATYDSGTNTVHFTTGTLATGGTASFQLTLAIGSGLTGALSNTATVAPPVGVTDPNSSNDSATDTDTLTPQADLSITKTDNQTSAVPGTNVTYTVVVTNNGPSAVVDAVVTDILSPGATFVSVTGPASFDVAANTIRSTTVTLAPGESVTYQVTVAIDPDLTGSLSNTATVAPPSGVTDPNLGNNSATDIDTLTPQADLSITKSDGKTSVVPGTDDTYTITVTNGGPSTVTGATVSDVLPAGTTFVSATGGATYDAGTNTVHFTAGILAPGASTSFELTLAVDPDLTGSLSNTATVSPPAGVTDPSGGNNSATDTDTLTPEADLSIFKSDGMDHVVPGTNTTYTITVTNNGPSTVTGATVSDPLPAGTVFVSATGGAVYDFGTNTVTYTTGTLAPGATTSFQLTLAVDAGLTTPLVNTATVTPPTGVIDPVSGNNSSTDTDALTLQADLSIAKSDGKTSVVPGTNTTYTITVTNNGPTSVTGAVVSDVLPAGTTFVSATGGAVYNFGTNTVTYTTGTLAPGGFISFDLTLAISPTATGTLSNTATVTPPSGFDGPAGSATDTDTLTPQADLSITKSDGTSSAVPGTNTTYTITVVNNGPSTVAGAVVSDILPIGTTFVSATNGAIYDAGSNTVRFTAGTLATGDTASFQLTLAIDPALTGTLTNTATVSPPNGVVDPIPANNTDSDTDTLTPQADLSIAKSDGKDNVVPGTNDTYTITVTNGGPSTVTGALVSDVLPAGATFVSATNGATYDAGTNTVRFVTGTVAPGATTSFDLVLALSPTLTGTFSNTATVTPPAGVTDPDGGNNSATDTDTLTPEADLSISKTDGKTTVIPGSSTNYTITVTNNGPSAVTGAAVSDVLPTGTTFVSATNGATYDSLTNTVTFITGTLAPGGSTSFQLTLNLAPDLTGSLSNTATVTPPTTVTDPVPGNDSETDTDTLTPLADLSIAKSDSAASATPGTNTTYTITVANNGPSTVTGAMVRDVLPAGTTFVSATNGATYDAGTNTVTFIAGSLAPVGTAGFQLTVAIDAGLTGTLSNTASVSLPNGVTDPNGGNNSATDTDSLSPQADLSITKDDGVTSAVPGADITYTITVTNNGPSTVTGATVSDPLPAGTTFVSATNEATYDPGTNTVQFTTGTLTSGGSARFELTLAIDPALTGTLSNTATVSPPAGVTDPNPANDSATDTDTLTPQADLSITKTDGKDSAVPGTDTTYTITVSNNGPSTVTGAMVSDLLPAGVTFVSATNGATYDAGSNTVQFTTGTLAAGDSDSFQLTVAISPTATGSLSNTATVSPPAGVTDPNSTNNSATDIDLLTPQADLSITKSDGVSSVVPGTNTTYTIVVTNNGPSTVTGAVVSDVLPAGVTFVSATGGATYDPVTNTVSATLGMLAPGASTSFNLTVAIGAASTGTLNNTATVSPPTGFFDPDETNNSATDTDTLTPQADLSITKTDGATTAVPGTNVTYTIVVTNNGPSTVTGATVSDVLPAGTTFVSTTGGVYDSAANTVHFTTGTLAPGGMTTFQLTVAVDPLATGTLSNTATVAPPSGVTDPTDGNNSATDIDTLTPQADLSIFKDDGKTSVAPGTNTTYTITVTNNGPSTVTGATVSDVLPTGTTFVSATNGATYDAGTNTVHYTAGTLATGDTTSFQLTLAIDPALAGSLSNTATVSPPSGVTDPTGGNNTATDTDVLTPQADLAIAKSDGTTSAVPGTTTTYTITVTNNGPSTVTGATVSDVLPAGTTFVSATGGATYDSDTNTVHFTTGTLATGGTTSFLLTLAINGTATGMLSNTATVSPPSGVTDPASGNNSATDTDTLTPRADLSITKSDGSASEVPGTNVTYTITVTNFGPSTVTGAAVSDVLPVGTTFVSATNGATYDAGTNTVHFTTDTLATGDSSSFQLTLAIDPTLTGTLSNTASVTPPTGVTDPAGGNNTATDTDTLTPQADLSIFKSDGQTSVVPGTNDTYTITVTNHGPSTVTGATVSDLLPAGTTFVSATNGATYDAGTNTVHFTTGMLAAGDTSSFQLTLAIDPALSGPLANTATVAPPAGVTDPVSGNNQSTDTGAPAPQADLSISKSDGTSTAVPGTNTTYTITVSNNGPSTVTGAMVSDPLPTGVTFVSATDGASYDPGTNTVQFTTGTLAPGDSTSFQLTVAIDPAATGSIVNTAMVSPPPGVTDPTPGNDSATDTDVLTPEADLSITKTDGTTNAVPGTNTTYTITVTNNGPSTVTGATVTDVLPTGVTFVSATNGAVLVADSVHFTTGTLAVGETNSFLLTVAIAPDLTVMLTNTATVAPPTGVIDNVPGNNSGTDTDTLTPVADLSIAKSDGTTSAVPGMSTTYTITVANNGPSTATNVSVSDPLPAGVTSFTWSGNGQSDVSGPLSDVIASLAPGANVVYTIVASIDPAATGSLTNTATVSAVGDPNTANNTASDTDTLTPQADLAIAKTDFTTTAIPGTNTTYMITVTNNGPSTVTGAVVSDVLPAGVTFVSATGGATYDAGANTVRFTTGRLAKNDSVRFDLTVAIDPALIGPLSNTATVTPPAGVTDSTPDNDSATDTDNLTPEADLSISKTDFKSSVVPGTSTTYFIGVTNNGPSTVTGATVTDVLPARTTFVSATGGATYNAGTNAVTFVTGMLAAGDSDGFTLTLAIDPALTGTLNNTATVAPPVGVTDPAPGNDTATDSDMLTPQADLSIAKTDGVTTAVPGTDTTYTITVTNNGVSTITGALVTDTLPAEVTFVSATNGATFSAGKVHFTTGMLAAGDSTSFDLTVAIDPALTGTLSNTATVALPTGVTDPNGGNNSATDTDTLTPQADLSIVKSDVGTSAVPGTDTTYTITVTNNGPSTVTGAAVSDMLPAGVTFVGATNGATYDAGTNTVHFTTGTLANGGAASFDLTVAIDPALTGTLSNTATVTPPAGVIDSTPGNDSSTDNDTLTPQADLSIRKTDGKTVEVPGTTTTYVITVTNNGPSTVTGAAVSDPLPAGVTFVSATNGATYDVGANTVRFTTGTLATGDSDSFLLTVAIDPTLTGTLSNTATVTPPVGVTDPNPGNDSATDTDDLVPEADLAITKSDGKSHVMPGTSTTYTITVTNNGPSTVTDALVTDPLPANTTFVSATNGATYDAGTNTVRFLTGTLASGESVSFDLTVAITPGLTGTLTNVAFVDAPEGVVDPVPGNSPAQDIDVLASPPVAVNDSSLHNPPGPVTLNVTNNDRDVDNNLLPSTVDLDPATPGQQTSLNVPGEGTWTVDRFGNVTFTPQPGFTHDPTPISYTDSDATGLVSNPATITIDYVPVAVDDVSIDNFVGTPVTVPVLANDTLGDAVVPSTVQIVGTAKPGDPLVTAEGTWTVNPSTGAITFTPTFGFAGDPAPIRYTVQDAQGNVSNAATVTIDYVDFAPIPVDVSLQNPRAPVTSAANSLGNKPAAVVAAAVASPSSPGLVLDIGSYAAYEEELARLSGYVYHDEDNDGRFGYDESGIGGVVVTVSGITNDGARWSRTVTTQEDGYYVFEFLPPGVYSVTRVQPNGYLDGSNSVGNVNGTRTGELAADNAIAQIVLPRDGEGTGYDFGNIQPASITGHVYRDDNQNGQWDDNEPALAGVTLRLTGLDDQHRNVSRTVETDENGYYAFRNLRPGAYQVTSVPRNGHVPVHGGVGSAGGTSENGSTVGGIMLPAGTRARNYDFGHAPNRARGMLDRPNDADGAGTRSARAIADDTSALLAFLLATTAIAGAAGFISGRCDSEMRRGAAIVTKKSDDREVTDYRNGKSFALQAP